MKRIGEAWERVGGLSEPSKMPGYGYGLPARACHIGSRLRVVNGSVCEHCYALKGRYIFPGVQACLERRLASITTETWVDDMTDLIMHYERSGYFRWHDSGDLQSVEHLSRIATIARRLQSIKFWLPTRELGIVRNYCDTTGTAGYPKNLIIRVSAPMVNGPRPPGFLNTSGVVSEKSRATCPAHKQKNNCGKCRRCWDRRVKHVAYPLH
jgi:hypothetical protein